MSTCISIHGEFGEHTFGDDPVMEFVCERCFVFDEAAALDALRAERNKSQRMAQRLADLTRGINDQLAPEIKRQKSEAWNEGHGAHSIDLDEECLCVDPYWEAGDDGER